MGRVEEEWYHFEVKKNGKEKQQNLRALWQIIMALTR